MTKILLIDDNILVRETVTLVLEDGGYEVANAEDGRRGVVAFQNLGPDLVITDLIMPVQNGLQTILEIRSIAPMARIVAISGGDRTRHTDLLGIARKLGASETLAKPLDPDELLACVRRCLAAA